MKLTRLVTAIVLLIISSMVLADSSLTHQHFAHLPMITGAKVSPDGKHVAAIYQSQKGPSVVVAEFGKRALGTVAQLKQGRDRIDEVVWAGSKRLLISASYSERYSRDRWRVSQFYAVNYDGSDVMLITPKANKNQASWTKELTLLSTLPNDDEHILVQAYDTRDKGQAVYKVNIYNNKFTKLFINKYRVRKWYADRDGNVRFGFGFKKNEPEVMQYWYRPDNDAEWKMINERRNMSGESFDPIGLFDGKLLVLSDREIGRDALWEFDPEKGEFKTLIYKHPKYDVTGVQLSSDRTRAIGATFQAHYPESHYFSDADAELSKAVAASIPGYKTVIASRDNSKKKMLVFAYKNDSPTKYFWLDFQNNAGGIWFSQYPYLEGKKLGATKPFTYKARDGMELNGYLTMPVTLPEGKKAPLVIMPHGGPFGPRDNQVFDYMVQFVANMGYAVLQPNFRGSGGYGNQYQTSGYKQFGLKMQTDVYDAIEWVKSNPLVNTENACMFGWSYGGYAALTAAFQQPDNYQCIVSVAGMSDLYKVVDDGIRRRSAIAEFYKESYGDVNVLAEAEQLKLASPINHVKKIKAPVLLIHGMNDTQVHYGQSEDFYEKADEAGVDIDYLEFKSGTHYLDENTNRLEAFKAIESFLSKHLKV